ncbi:unnamed protein product [Closterium sp. NIES-53]
MNLMRCTRPDLTYPLSLRARYVALGRHRKVHWDPAKRVLRYLCSTSGMGLVLGGRGPVVLTGHADASWAMIALCQEHRLEHRTKHIALRYFLARDLQQRGIASRYTKQDTSTSGMGLVLGGRGPVVLTGHADASWVDDSATQRSSSCEAEIYAGAMAAQELRWLTYLLTDLGE